MPEKTFFLNILCVMVHDWGFGNTDTRAHVFNRFSIVAQPSAGLVTPSSVLTSSSIHCDGAVHLLHKVVGLIPARSFSSQNQNHVHVRLFGDSKLSLCELMICDFSE